MTAAADRLIAFWNDHCDEDDPLSPQFAEAIVQAIINIEHEDWTTLKQRMAKAIKVEFGFNTNETERLEFIAASILLRVGLEPMGDGNFRIEGNVGSVVSTKNWSALLNRHFSPADWTTLSPYMKDTYDPETGKFDIARLQGILERVFPGTEIMRVERRDET